MYISESCGVSHKLILPKSFFTGLLSIHYLPSLYLCFRLLCPMCRTLYMALLNCMQFACSHLSSLSRSRWAASLPTSVTTRPHSLVSGKYGESALNPTIHVSDRNVRHSTKTDHWRMSLLTDLHLDTEPVAETLWVLASSQFHIHWVVYTSNPCPLKLETRM